jgi:hypothetical protein
MTERLYGATKVEIFLEPSGDGGAEVGVRLPGEKLMWMDADDGFIPRELELEIGNAKIFDHASDAMSAATCYINKNLKGLGWR